MLIYRFITEGTIEEKIIEKAESKLYLDALVIQQGRFVEKQKGVNKEDLMKMITFGADHIFESNTDVEDLTEKDIDQILQLGEKKTEQISENLKNNKMSLASFAVAENENSSLYTYKGFLFIFFFFYFFFFIFLFLFLSILFLFLFLFIF